mmetsp:Transcript_12182/g.27808  ORF Transcript_12182/g.27808 Transcript_12182/m.27808 type:complete len:119 (+) Transcript_12182:764-1120(+)
MAGEPPDDATEDETDAGDAGGDRGLRGASARRPVQSGDENKRPRPSPRTSARSTPPPSPSRRRASRSSSRTTWRRRTSAGTTGRDSAAWSGGETSASEDHQATQYAFTDPEEIVFVEI